MTVDGVKKAAWWAVGITIVLALFGGPTYAADAWEGLISTISTFFTSLGFGGG